MTPKVTLNITFTDRLNIEISGENIEHINGRMYQLLQRKLQRAIRAERSTQLFASRKAAKEAEQMKEAGDTEDILSDAILPETPEPEFNEEVLDDPAIGLAGGSVEEAIEDEERLT